MLEPSTILFAVAQPGSWNAFLAVVGQLAANPLTLLLALALTGLVRGWPHALLVTINLALFAELLHKVTVPDYAYGELLAARLVASALQVALALGAVALWRRWRAHFDRVTAE